MGIKSWVLEWLLEDIQIKLDMIYAVVKDIQRKEERQMLGMADIQANVVAQGTVVESVVTLLTQLSAMLNEAKQDPAKVQEIIDQININTAALAEAVVINTPATP
jgi:hypothetical protein